MFIGTPLSFKERGRAPIVRRGEVIPFGSGLRIKIPLVISVINIHLIFLFFLKKRFYLTKLNFYFTSFQSFSSGMIIKSDYMILPIYVVDAFTDVPFKGNTAAICFLNETIDYALKQKIASEMNLGITAFLLQESDDSYNLSWFTPVAEVNLCGHATLAASHIIFNSGMCAKDGTLHFITKSGELRTQLNDGMIVMDFPASSKSK